MFKRMQKLNAKLDKSRARGERDEDAGPPEMALDDESSSSSSSSSSSDGESSGSSSDSESDARSAGQARPAKRSRKSIEDAAEKDSDDDESSESSDKDSDDSDESDSGVSSSSAIPISHEDDKILRPSIAEALRDCIYIKPGAVARQGFTHRSCYLCPKALLKNQKMIDTHMAGGSHTRRHKRFVQYTEKKLKPEQKRDPREGGLDAPSVVAEIDGTISTKEEKQKQRKKEVKLQQREAKHKRILAKKASKQALKDQKEALRIAGTQGISNKKRKLSTGETTGNGAVPAKDTSVPVTEHAVLDTTSTAIIPIPKKQKVVPRKRLPLAPKAERKARRKEKQALRQTRKYEERKAKRARKAAKEAGKGSATTTTPTTV